MTGQLAINFAKGRAKPIQQRFDEFHRANPHVYQGLRDLALTARRRGRDRGSIELFFAVMRWEHWIHTDDPHSDFKLNDHFSSRYARLLAKNEPELATFFETRELRTP